MTRHLNERGIIILLDTGSNRLVVRAICTELPQREHDVHGVVSDATSSCGQRSTLVEVGDISPSTNWSGALNGVNVVIHLAPRVHVMHDTATDPMSAFRVVNVGETLNLARQAASAGVKLFVFISTFKVNGESTMPGRAIIQADAPNLQDEYGQSKHKTEHKTERELASTRCPHRHLSVHNPPSAGVWPRRQGQLCRSHSRCAARDAFADGRGAQPAQLGSVRQPSRFHRHLHHLPQCGQPDFFSQ
jgi:UDP-glucose 4-epimerase